MFSTFIFKPEFLKEFAVLAGLVSAQFVYAAFGVWISKLISLGVSHLFLIICGSFATFLFFSPLSIIFERKKWPSKFSLKLLGQLVLISFGGVTVSQALALIGLEKTSPAVASAMPNLAPGIIFIIAWALRFEKVDLKCWHSKVKILGTLLCIVGAILMSVFTHASASKSISQNAPSSSNAPTINKDKVTGTICLMSAVIISSFLIVLQAATLRELPAPMSLCVATALLGSIFTALLQCIQEHKLEIGLPLGSVVKVLLYAVSVGFVGGGCASFYSWAMKKKGPVFVSTFSPIGTMFSVALCAIALGDTITIGSLIGMFLMFSGLYMVLMAKKKEESQGRDDDNDSGGVLESSDAEKPLLR